MSDLMKELEKEIKENNKQVNEMFSGLALIKVEDIERFQKKHDDLCKKYDELRFSYLKSLQEKNLLEARNSDLKEINKWLLEVLEIAVIELNKLRPLWSDKLAHIRDEMINNLDKALRRTTRGGEQDVSNRLE